MTEPEYVSATEAARRLDITDTAIRKRIKRGTLAAKKVGREWRIPVTELPDSSVTEPDPEDDGSANEPEPTREGSLTEPSPSPDMPERSATEPEARDTALWEFGDRTREDESEPNPFGDRASPDAEVEGEANASPPDAHDAPTLTRYEAEGIEVENKLLRLKLESVEREHEATRRHLDSVLGEIDHLRTVNDRLSIAVTNEQVLRLGSAPQPEAIGAMVTDLGPADDLPESSETPQEDASATVTIRGSKRPGWFGRLFGSK
ncbi:excisionase family DNA-binding protein [Candidatus Poribacteria bacterium]|jgi:excisionase family DNA binding protein|nr:excisionase family DNA-binding protein [Candidatus Poribacteria bacterium]MBT5533490.1 excisionase family DNA-binding protein [Candidatus Poribacteria bacterium]MBT5711481.1 excisionase family DNA-binding protein [Candidatus Poribacteria bacterium]MBT7100525.1 excisionase family DNA-binding protein [Candidatus Poribacteria bacterium]MBT7808907.1 excisionase family DNA-binding protein [Candidatus Poribacteria bacterium]